MCNMVYKAVVKYGNKTALRDVRRIAGAYEAKDWIPDSPQSIMKNIVHTVYMGKCIFKRDITLANQVFR